MSAIDGASTTQEVAHAYMAAWIAGDAAAVQRLLADDVSFKCNLGRPTDPPRAVETLVRLASALDTVTLVAETYADGRAVLVYDCVTRQPSGTVRTVEFLEIVGDRVREARRVYDLAAAARLLPDLVA